MIQNIQIENVRRGLTGSKLQLSSIDEIQNSRNLLLKPMEGPAFKVELPEFTHTLS